MSFYRAILATVAAMALVSPVFADDTTSTTGTTDTSMQQTSSTEQSSTSTEQTKVDVNKASTKDLMKVKGLNASRAKAIVAYRKKHGDFKSLDELSNVKGMKKLNSDTLKNIQDQMSVE